MPTLTPSPLEQLADGLWVKRDDLVSPLFGGNKARKLASLLPIAARLGRTKIATFGAAGSHHVLASAIWGKAYGMQVKAAITPQVETAHVRLILRHSHAAAELTPLTGARTAARWLAAQALDPATWILPPGGSTVAGAESYLGCVEEIASQWPISEAPPTAIFVAAGSGGTAAGLAVGVAAQGWPTNVFAVAVAQPSPLLELQARQLTARLALKRKLPVGTALARLHWNRGWVGKGYGHPMPLDHSKLLAKAGGFELEPTYTERALEAAYRFGRRRPEQRVVYVHTLGSPAGPLPPSVPRSLAEPLLLRHQDYA